MRCRRFNDVGYELFRLNKPAFKKLADEKLFKEVYLDYGVTVWENGEIDIAPETLYEGSVDASASA